MCTGRHNIAYSLLLHCNLISCVRPLVDHELRVVLFWCIRFFMILMCILSIKISTRVTIIIGLSIVIYYSGLLCLAVVTRFLLLLCDFTARGVQ